MDVARWGLGVKYPTKVSAIGGMFMFDNDQETPNTLNCAFEFNEEGKHKMLEFEVRHWMTQPRSHRGCASPNPARQAQAKPAADDGDGPAPAARAANRPRRAPDSIGNLFYGSKGYLAVDSYRSYHSWLGEDGARPVEQQRRRPLPQLHRDGEEPQTRRFHAEIEEGAASTVLVHLANISYRVGRTLHFDAASMTIKGDSEANKLLTRNYRKPFVVPEKV